MTDRIIENYVSDTIERDYLMATGQPVPLDLTARISQAEHLARVRLTPAQLAEAEQLVVAERFEQQGKLMAEHQAARQEKMAERIDAKTKDLTATRVGEGLTYEQYEQARKTGKYKKPGRKSTLDLSRFRAAAKERGLSLQAFEKKLDDALDHAKSEHLTDAMLKDLDIDEDTLKAWGENRILYGMERRKIERGEYDDPDEIEVELDDEADMRIDVLDAFSQHEDVGPDIDPRSLEEDSMRGDVARAMAAHTE